MSLVPFVALERVIQNQNSISNLSLKVKIFFVWLVSGEGRFAQAGRTGFWDESGTKCYTYFGTRPIFRVTSRPIEQSARPILVQWGMDSPQTAKEVLPR